MKKFFVFCALFVGLTFVANATNANYYISDSSVDQLFAQSTEISLLNVDFNNLMTNNASQTVVQEKNAVVAWALCWVVGGFGIHRHYLGTKGSMWAIYTFTCFGIFGIVPTVDWFVLLIDGIVNKNIQKYENNEKFFMWS